MESATLLLLLTAAVPAAVEVSSLNGEQHTGELVRLDDAELVLKTTSAEIRVPVAELLEVRVAGSESPVPAPADAIEVRLTDDSRLLCTQVGVADETATLTHPQLGTLPVPERSVRSLRFGPLDSGLEGKWNEFLQRDLSKDLLVVRKGDVLDHLDGVIGSITPETVHFLLDGDDIPVKREKVFGLIYYRRETPTARPVARVELGDGETVQVRKISWDGQGWKAQLVSGADVIFPSDSLRAVDFSLGKIRYLSAMEPREVKQTPYFDIVWKYGEDSYLFGGPIRLAHKSYARGLSLSSGTLLRYRLGGEYRRFQAVMGIDDRAKAANGDLDVLIRGDGKPLLTKKVRGSDPPEPIDLDVSGVVELEIEIGFGGNLAIGDFLDLAEARVIK